MSPPPKEVTSVFAGFTTLSGLKEKQIVGTHWATWNDAKREAGLGTAVFVRPRLDEDRVLPVFASLLAQLGKWPTESELRLAKRRDARFPSVKVSRRLESDHELLAKLRAFCESKPHLASVVDLVTERSRRSYRSGTTLVATVGYVYMMRSGRRYKIGHTSSPSRRHREVRLDLPERTDVVHSIETDDPSGIEAYWHRRFASKRVRETEFFARFFNALGFRADRWQELAALRKQHLTQSAEVVPVAADGQKFRIRANLVGPKGEPAMVVSIWFIRPNESAPRFVTAFPGGRR